MKPHWPCRAHVRNLPEVEGEENPAVEEDTHSVTEEPTQKTGSHPGWLTMQGGTWGEALNPLSPLSLLDSKENANSAEL